MASKQSVVKRKKTPGFIIPLVLALIVSLLFYQGIQRKILAEVMPTLVPIAKVDLFQHTQIQETDIAMVTIPIKGIPPGVITDPKEIIGKYVGTQFTILKNGYFMKGAVSELDDIPTKVSMLLGPNQLGITLELDLEKSVANSLEVNQDVQVRFFTTKTPSNQPFEGALFDRMKILALRSSTGTDVVNIDKNATSSSEDKDNKKGTTTTPKNQVPTILVFEANEEQVRYLILAQAMGSLNLVALPKNVKAADGIRDEESTTDPTDSKYPSTGQTEAAKDQGIGDQSIKDVLSAVSSKLTEEQMNVLQNALLEKPATKEGHLYQKNAAQVLIDSMSYSIKSLFEENGILSTANGEIVYYDAPTGQIRYFKDKSEYEGSIYALSQFSPEEIAQLKQDGKLTGAQLEALKSQENSVIEPQYSQTTKGELFQIVDEKVKFYTESEVISTLTAIKEKNGRLSQENEALLQELLGETAKNKEQNAQSTKNANTDTDTGTGNQSETPKKE